MSEETNKQSAQTEQPPKQYTEKEMKEMRASTLKFYKEETVFLRAQASYENAKADISENKLRDYVSQLKLSNFVVQQEQAQAEYEADLSAGKIDAAGNTIGEAPVESKPKRKLKQN